jgi:hypothetical protein
LFQLILLVQVTGVGEADVSFPQTQKASASVSGETNQYAVRQLNIVYSGDDPGGKFSFEFSRSPKERIDIAPGIGAFPSEKQSISSGALNIAGPGPPTETPQM